MTPSDQYEPDLAEFAAKLWEQLATFGGEDADAQRRIELDVRAYTKALQDELDAASETIVERDSKIVELTEANDRIVPLINALRERISTLTTNGDLFDLVDIVMEHRELIEKQ